jgi:hypothetical protein
MFWDSRSETNMECILRKKDLIILSSVKRGEQQSVSGSRPRVFSRDLVIEREGPLRSIIRFIFQSYYVPHILRGYAWSKVTIFSTFEN